MEKIRRPTMQKLTCKNCKSENIEIVTETKQKPRSEWFFLFTIISVAASIGLFFLFLNVITTIEINYEIELKDFFIKEFPKFFSKITIYITAIFFLLLTFYIIAFFVLKPKNITNRNIIICKDCSAAFELDVAELVEKTKLTNPKETKDQ